MTMPVKQSSGDFQPNPFWQLLDATKAVFTYTLYPLLFLFVAPFVIGLINLFLQVVNEIVVPSDSENLTPTQTIYIIIVSLVSMVIVIGLQLFIAGLGVVIGVAASQGRMLTIGQAIHELVQKLGRFVLVGLWVFLYVLPWVGGLVSVWVLAVVAMASDPGIIPVIVPLSIALSIAAGIGIVRVQLRYSLAAIHVFASHESAGKAMRRSKALTRGRLMEPFGISSIGSAVPILGPVISPAGLARYYQQRLHTDDKHLPSVHWLNYLMLIIVGGFILVIVVMIGLIVLLVNLTSA